MEKCCSWMGGFVNVAVQMPGGLSRVTADKSA